MAFSAKDGSKHTNHSSMKQADAKHMAKMPQRPPVDMEEHEPDANDPMEASEGENEGAAMAQQHGPAVEVNISHDQQTGRHSVHAVHPDGHSHETEHASAQEAHKYAGDCAGCGSM